MSKSDLSIRDVVRATGVGEATLRAWERRYGFPSPRRASSGHRRYRADDVERIARVLAERERGLTLPVAIERARGATSGVPSIFARLRDGVPDLQPVTVRKRLLTELTHAVEEESCSRAERPVLIGCFQRERFYRQSEARWRDLARGAETALALADFERLRRPRGGPMEIPVDRSHPLTREWALICAAAEHGACLVAWEPPGRSPATDGDREFELVFSVEPEVVRAAAEEAVAIAAARVPELAESTGERLSGSPAPRAAAQLRLSTAITARLLGRLG